jgi:hypothetical protein
MFFVFHLLYVLRRQASELFGDNSNVDLKVMGRGSSPHREGDGKARGRFNEPTNIMSIFCN